MDLHVPEKLLEVLFQGSYLIGIAIALRLLDLDCKGRITELLLSIDSCKLSRCSLDSNLGDRGVLEKHHVIKLEQEECNCYKFYDKRNDSTDSGSCFALAPKIEGRRTLGECVVRINLIQHLVFFIDLCLLF